MLAVADFSNKFALEKKENKDLDKLRKDLHPNFISLKYLSILFFFISRYLLSFFTKTIPIRGKTFKYKHVLQDLYYNIDFNEYSVIYILSTLSITLLITSVLFPNHISPNWPHFYLWPNSVFIFFFETIYLNNADFYLFSDEICLGDSVQPPSLLLGCIAWMI